MTLRVTTALAGVALALASALAARDAWGHTFPQVRTVVVQVEPCEVVLLVGYRPASGEATEAILSRVATQPESKRFDAIREVMAAYAMAPLEVSLDGKSLSPRSVDAKIGLEPGGARPMLVLLVTYSAQAGGALAIRSKEPRSTRISWQDQQSGRVDLENAPAQGRTFGQVASFLLNLSPSKGEPACPLSSQSTERPASTWPRSR